MTQSHPFRRYAELIDDWSAFDAAIARPLPVTLWANSARLDRDTLRRLLAREGVDSEPLVWQPAAVRAAAGFAPGRHWGFFAGLFQIQEEAAMLPVALLDPRPGERILDLCAAPGNKTAQIATVLGGTGTVVANELKRGRLGALRQTLKRLGLVNVAITARPGQEYPLRAGPFDRVLVDAPCSGEGTIRKNPTAMGTDETGRSYLVNQQRRMLSRALRLVRPGGRVVYATCTLAPEENECVVADVLEEMAGAARLVPATVAGFRTTPGLTRWAGRELDGSLAGALRVWPHHNDTGGFFVAVLERDGGDDIQGPELSAPEGAPEDGLDAAAEWFGLPAGWRDGLRPIRWGGRYLQLLAADARLPARPPLEYCGLPTLGIQVRPAKLTTAAAIRFGDFARRQFVEIDSAQAGAFLRRAPFELGEAQAQNCQSGPGHVLVRYQGYTLGVGDMRRQAGRYRVDSLFPKAWSALAGKPEQES
ncbi:RsmB/NOP family class I SAM-dependent RNA methyltransferase [Ectothiorhodospiraceae bacterium WFHF3C12]|nr:RsmB/NOP family class I SAM-dependent RNA methyltransferase [Ectothiorhodospiraceae bacterium WFHF3C12]